MSKLIYQLSYLLNLTPWNITEMPSEIVTTLETMDEPPANALDIGCGSGAYSMYLAGQGWHVTGIDYVSTSIKQARKKAGRKGIEVDFRVGDITQLSSMALPPMKLVLDIKCSHGLAPDQLEKYIHELWSVMDENSLLLLEAVKPRKEMGIRFGLSATTVSQTFGQRFRLEESKQNDASGWYWLRK